MPLQYSVSARPNPRDPEQAKKFYATAKAKTVIEVRDLCKMCRAHSTFTVGDTMGVIESLLEHAIEQLQLGNIVRLGAFGSFRLSINDQKGTDTLEEFSESNIGGCHVIFSAGKDLTDMCSTMTYQCITPKKQTATEDDTEETVTD